VTFVIFTNFYSFILFRLNTNKYLCGINLWQMGKKKDKKRKKKKIEILTNQGLSSLGKVKSKCCKKYKKAEKKRCKKCPCFDLMKQVA
jgi:hypothetical protein